MSEDANKVQAEKMKAFLERRTAVVNNNNNMRYGTKGEIKGYRSPVLDKNTVKKRDKH